MQNSQFPLARIEVDAADEGLRLDVFLGTHVPVLSRNAWKKAISMGLVRIERAAQAQSVKKSETLRAGDRVRLDEQAIREELLGVPKADSEAAARLGLIYRDEAIIVVDKAPGMASHPLAAGESGTALNGIAYLAPSVLSAGDKILEGGLVHRLDAETSGLLVAALDSSSFAELRAEFSGIGIVKRYIALVEGDIENGMEVEFGIAHHARDTRRMVVVPPENDMGKAVPPRLRGPFRGKPRAALSKISVRARYGTHTLIQVELSHGQMHQVRVHCAAIGHPLEADAIYGGSGSLMNRHALHASEIHFLHPFRSAPSSFEAPLPEDFRQAIRSLESRIGG